MSLVRLNMIALTKLNGESFMLNALYIEQVQAFPDTTITMTNGKKLVVKDSVQQVEERISSFYRKIALLPINTSVEEED